MNKPIYLDKAGTFGYIPKLVLKSIMPFLTEMCGNASSLYSLGREANNAVKQAYDNVQSLIEGGAPSNKDVRGWIALTSAVEKYRAEISKARAAQTAISKGKSIFAAWDAESEERNVARLAQYNNAVKQKGG